MSTPTNHTLPLKRVFFRYWTTTGPRILQAGIELLSSPSDTLIIESKATWPEGDDYSEAISEEIRRVVSERSSGVFGARITIEEIEFHEVGSSERMFRIAAREAARSLFTTSDPLD